MLQPLEQKELESLNTPHVSPPSLDEILTPQPLDGIDNSNMNNSINGDIGQDGEVLPPSPPSPPPPPPFYYEDDDPIPSTSAEGETPLPPSASPPPPTEPTPPPQIVTPDIITKRRKTHKNFPHLVTTMSSGPKVLLARETVQERKDRTKRMPSTNTTANKRVDASNGQQQPSLSDHSQRKRKPSRSLSRSPSPVFRTKYRKETYNTKLPPDPSLKHQFEKEQIDLAVKRTLGRKGKKFECSICGDSFVSPKGLDSHVVKKHKDSFLAEKLVVEKGKEKKVTKAKSGTSSTSTTAKKSLPAKNIGLKNKIDAKLKKKGSNSKDKGTTRKTRAKTTSTPTTASSSSSTATTSRGRGGARGGKRGRGAGRGGTRGGTTSASRKRSAYDDSYFKKPKLDAELFGDSSDTDSTEESEIDDRKKDRDYRPWK